MGVRYFAFGEMAVSVDGVRHPLTRRRERSVLSVLLAAGGAPVAAERLVAEVWGDETPGQPLSSLQVTVSRLRGRLEPGRTARTGTCLTSTAAGYAVQAAVADVDTWSFQALAESALAATEPRERLARCDEALALWAGQPYAHDEAPTVRHEITRLNDLQLTVVEHRARSLLDIGRPAEAHRDLADLAAAHPYREGLWSLLALAQYQSSRQADALGTLRTLRSALAEELGVDPLPETRQLEAAMLRQDSALDGVVSVAPLTQAGSVTTFEPCAPDASVGRAAVLEQLWQIQAGAVADRRSRFVLVAGEAGIGKSRLVEDLVASADSHGASVIVGHCLEGDYAPALWPWLGVVRQLVERAAPSPVNPYLEPLLTGESPADGSGAGTTLRMFDAVVDLLARTADQTPLIVVIEDLHWSDDSSLLLLRHLAGAAPAAALTVACTRRTTDAHTRAELLDTMAALARAGSERVRLDGLDRASVRALLNRSVGAHDARLDGFVADVTAGNPFFVLQYARLLAARPDLADVDITSLPVPDGVRDVLRQRIARLPEVAARLLTSASVLGRQIDPDLLAELTDTPLDTCLDGLDLALTSGLLKERQTGYAFAHTLARETLYPDLSIARRMRLHDKAGRLIERRLAGDPDAAAEIAHHAHVAAPLGPEHAERACAWLARAADVAVTRNAHPEAVDLWQHVLSNSTPRSPTAAAAHRGKAAALIRLGRMAEAHPALDTAVAIAREHGDWRMVAEAATVLRGAGAWTWREHGVVHTPLVDAFTAAVPHVDPASQARLLAVLQIEHFYSWNTRVVEDYGHRSIELARQSDDPGLLREVLMLRLIASSGSRNAAARLALVEELLGLDPQGELGVMALFYLGQVRWDSADPDGADEAMRRCAAAAETLRHTGLDIPLGWWRAARARDLDDPSHDALVDEVLTTHRRAGYLATRELDCLAAIRCGPIGAPVDDATIALAEPGGMPLRALVAHALLEAGRPDRAHALLGEPVPDDIVDYCSTAGRCLRLLVLADTGKEAEIRAALAPVEDLRGAPVSYGTIDHLGVVDHFVAAAYAALGDDRAAEVARAAVEGNRRLGVVPWLRRSEALLARLT